MAVFLNGECIMKKDDLKDFFETLAIVAISAFLVVSINKKCSDAMQKLTNTKTETFQKVR